MTREFRIRAQDGKVLFIFLSSTGDLPDRAKSTLASLFAALEKQFGRAWHRALLSEYGKDRDENKKQHTLPIVCTLSAFRNSGAENVRIAFALTVTRGGKTLGSARYEFVYSETDGRYLRAEP